MPVLSGDLAFLQGPTHRCVAVSQSRGEIVWQSKAGERVSPRLMVSGDLLTIASAKGRPQWLELRSPQDGSLIRRVDRPLGLHAFAREGTVIAGGLSRVSAFDPSSERGWSVAFPQAHWISSTLDANSDCVCFALQGGSVVCLDVRTGAERWRRSVDDRDDHGRPGEGRQVFICGPRVLVAVSGRYVVAFSLGSGRRLWSYEGGTHPAKLVGNRFVVEAGELDPVNGELTRRGVLEWPKSLRDEGIGSQGEWAVSESHIFSGTNDGYMVAWARATGKYVWHFKPKGAFSAAQGATPLVIHNGRLFYGDNNGSVYCLESADRPTGARRRSRDEISRP